MPTHSRLLTPYLDTPRTRARCFTGTDITRMPARCTRARQEAMHVIEVGQLEKQRAFEQLDAAAGIGCAIVQHAPAHPIGNAR